MVTSIFTNLLLFQGGQLVQELLIKKYAANSSSHLITCNNYTIKMYFLTRDTSVATNHTKVVLFELSSSGIW